MRRPAVRTATFALIGPPEGGALLRLELPDRRGDALHDRFRVAARGLDADGRAGRHRVQSKTNLALPAFDVCVVTLRHGIPDLFRRDSRKRTQLLNRLIQ